MTASFVVYRRRFGRRNQRWRWKLVHSNGRKIANGGEGYSDRAEAERMGLSVIRGRYADAAVTIEGPVV